MKKLTTLLLTFAMVLSLMTGCGGSTTSSSSAAAASDSGTASQASEGTGETNWPEKAVTITVPYAAGGDSDFNARLLAEKLTEKLGQSFVVQNIAGNSGATGVRQALNTEPDGYNISFCHTAFIVNYYAGASDLTYDDMSFGAIVGLLPAESDVLVCRPKLGISKLSELKAYTEEHPGELIFGAASGTTVLVNGLKLRENGFDITLVDTGGTSERMTAILGDHVDFVSVPRGNAKDYLATGELIEIENDMGIDISCPAYYQMNFPKGTDPAIIEAFNVAVADIINNDEDYAKRIYDAYQQEPFYMDSEEGEAFVRDMWEEFSTWNWSI